MAPPLGKIIHMAPPPDILRPGNSCHFSGKTKNHGTAHNLSGNAYKV